MTADGLSSCTIVGGHRPPLQLIPYSFIRLVQRLPAAKARLDIVPIANRFFPELPAQIDHPSLPHVRKIAEALVDVLQQDAHFLDLVAEDHEVGNRIDVRHSKLAEPVLRTALPRLLNFRMKLADSSPFIRDLPEDRTELGNEVFSFH